MVTPTQPRRSNDETRPPSSARERARQQLELAFCELRRLVARVAKLVAAAPGELVDANASVTLRGLCSFSFDEGAAVLRFQIGARPPDAIRWDDGVRSLVRSRSPGEPVDPVGFLRGELFDELGARGGSVPPSGL